MKNRPLTQLKSRPGNSSLWNDLLKVKDLYLQSRSMVVGNGKKTDFWLDPWCGVVSLKDKFPYLYDICADQNIKVREAAARGRALTFKRWLDVSKQTQMRRLRDILTTCPLNTTEDIPKWNWEKIANSLLS